MEFSRQLRFAAVLPLKKYHPLVNEQKAENAEKPELKVLKKKKSISPGMKTAFLGFPGCTVVTIL